jgi:hypothetical protein
MVMALSNFFKSNSNDPYAPAVDRKKVFLVAGVGLALIVAIILFVMSLGGGAKDTYMSMLVRHQNLLTIIEDSQNRIRSGALAKVNSEAILLFTSDSVALQDQLKKKFSEDKLTDDAKKRAAEPTIEQKLTDAELLDKFDVTYRNLVREQINKLMVAALEVQDSTGGKTFLEVMDKYVNDLQTIDNQLSELSL